MKANKSLRAVYITLGTASLILGIVGAFLPGLPTTVFILIAAYFYSKSSDRLYRALINSKRFGKIIRDWEESKIMPSRAKFIAYISMLISSVVVLFSDIDIVVRLAIVTLIALCAVCVYNLRSDKM